MLKNIINSNLIFALLFTLSIIAQCEIFHYQIFNEFAISSIFKTPKLFLLFHLPKISIALFITSFAFIFKRKFWSIIISIILNFWILANLFYFRVTNSFIDEYSIKLTNNMNSFWNSIFGLLQSSDFIYLYISIILIIFTIITKPKHSKCLKLFSITIVCSIILGLITGILLSLNNQIKRNYINPFLSYKAGWINNCQLYIKDHSIFHYLFYVTKDLIYSKEEDLYILKKEEEILAAQFINPKSIVKPKTPLVICLIESFDEFVVRPEFMPNICNFIQNQNNILYAKVKSQIKEGISSDGQLIIETGLLPISQGTVCFRFYNNKFPSLSSLYSKSADLFPHGLNAWNQHAMSKAYNIDTNFVTNIYNDDSLMNITISIAHKFDKVLMVTMSTHSPYYIYPNESKLITNNNYPQIINDYIKSFNVVDKKIANFLKEIVTDQRLKESTIVIVGDHAAPITSEDQSLLKDSVDFSICPLIIYSPTIKDKKIINEICYQMDIFPTILNLIGCQNYYWKGFGINILDSTARNNRTISEDEAFTLSDKLIRANFFKKYEE